MTENKKICQFLSLLNLIPKKESIIQKNKRSKIKQKNISRMPFVLYATKFRPARTVDKHRKSGADYEEFCRTGIDVLCNLKNGPLNKKPKIENLFTDRTNQNKCKFKFINFKQ